MKMSKRQLAIFNRLMDSGKNSYLTSFKGMRTTPRDIGLIQDWKFVLSSKINSTNERKSIPINLVKREIYSVTRGCHSPLPVKFGEWCGIEIECFIPFSSFETKPHAGGCGDCDECSNDNEERCDEYSESNINFRAAINELKELIHKKGIKYVGITEDGSLGHDDSGFVPLEFKILTLHNDFTNLKKLCDLLRELDAQVNSSCGLHVHFDNREQKNKDNKHNYFKARWKGYRLNSVLPLIASLVPPSRRNNYYCQLKMSSKDRYSAINMSALREHNTIEVRLHSGTTNFTKITNWITLLYAIMNKKGFKGKNVTDLKSLFDELYGKEWNEETKKLFLYFKLRQEKFVGTLPEELEIETENSEYEYDPNSIQITFDAGTNSITLDGKTFIFSRPVITQTASEGA